MLLIQGEKCSTMLCLREFHEGNDQGYHPKLIVCWGKIRRSNSPRRSFMRGKCAEVNCSGGIRSGPKPIGTCSKWYFIGGDCSWDSFPWRNYSAGMVHGANFQGSRNKFCYVLLGKSIFYDLDFFLSWELFFQRLLVL